MKPASTNNGSSSNPYRRVRRPVGRPPPPPLPPRRLLFERGGVFAHVDLPGYAHLDPLTAYVMDWDTEHNGEPFWRGFHEIDIEQVYRDAGFIDVETRPAHSNLGSSGDYYQGKFDYHVVMGRKP